MDFCIRTMVKYYVGTEEEKVGLSGIFSHLIEVMISNHSLFGIYCSLVLPVEGFKFLSFLMSLRLKR